MLPLKRVPSLQGLVLLSAPVVASVTADSTTAESYEMASPVQDESCRFEVPRGSPLTVDHHLPVASALYLNFDADNSGGLRQARALLDDQMMVDNFSSSSSSVGHARTAASNSKAVGRPSDLWGHDDGGVIQRPTSSVVGPPRSSTNNNTQQLFGGGGGAAGQNDARQYKTRLCVYLSSPGGCPHGSRCFFAHGIGELRPIVNLQQQQQQQQQQPSQREYKTKPCRYSFSECPFAAVGRCQFAHSLEELRAQQPTTNQNTQNSILGNNGGVDASSLASLLSGGSAPFGGVTTATRGGLGGFGSGLGGGFSTSPTASPFGGGNGMNANVGATTTTNQGGTSLAALSVAPVPSRSSSAGSQNVPVLSKQQDDTHAAQQAAAAANHARRFKTRLCKYHMAGHCPYAATNTCQFAHSEEELRVPPQRTWRPSNVDTHWGGYNNNNNNNGGNNTTQNAGGNNNNNNQHNGQTHTQNNTSSLGGMHDNASVLSETHSSLSSGGQNSPPMSSSAKNGGGLGTSSLSSLSSTTSSYQNQNQSQNQTTQHQTTQQAQPPAATTTNIAVASNAAAQNGAAATTTTTNAAAAAANQGHQSGAALRAALEQKRFTKLCKYFLAGHCPFAASGTCQFAHSASELRRRSPPPAQGAHLGVLQRSPPARHRKPAEHTNPFANGGHVVAGTFGGINDNLSDVVATTGLGVDSFQQPDQPKFDGWSADAFSFAVGRRQPDWSFRAEDAATAAL